MTWQRLKQTGRAVTLFYLLYLHIICADFQIWSSFTPVPMILNRPGCAALLVKSRTSAGICRNLNRILCFHDAHGFSEIGFVRRIFADFARPTHLGYRDGFGPGSRF